MCRCRGCFLCRCVLCACDLLIVLQVTDAYAGPTVSLSLYVNGAEQKNFSEPLLLALPVSIAESAGPENCVGQPSVYSYIC